MGMLSDYAAQAVADLGAHSGEFDAIVVSGDHHGITIGAVIASVLDKPLMIVCLEEHHCVVSHITGIGECRPELRYLYVDDWFWGGASRATAFAYMNQSEHAPIVATYAATLRKYEPITQEV